MKTLNFDDLLKICEMGISLVGFGIAYLVFAMQAKTYEAQIAVTTLEQKKFILSIRPEFVIAIVQTSAPLNGLVDCFVELELKKNIALGYYVKNNTDFLKYITTWDFGPYAPVGKKIRIFDGQIPLNFGNRMIDMDIYFCDELGTKYYQKITHFFHKPAISPPAVVPEVTLK